MTADIDPIDNEKGLLGALIYHKVRYMVGVGKFFCCRKKSKKSWCWMGLTERLLFFFSFAKNYQMSLQKGIVFRNIPWIVISGYFFLYTTIYAKHGILIFLWFLSILLKEYHLSLLLQPPEPNRSLVYYKFCITYFLCLYLLTLQTTSIKRIDHSLQEDIQINVGPMNE